MFLSIVLNFIICYSYEFFVTSRIEKIWAIKTKQSFTSKRIENMQKMKGDYEKQSQDEFKDKN